MRPISATSCSKACACSAQNDDILAQYQGRFKFMLVDEYQDTNVVQYLWLRLLAQGRHNLCCVGDDDQSIYGWRGAEVDNILRFEHDFPGATVVRLENNYRSTGHILGAASGLIAHNEDRLGKTLFTDGANSAKSRPSSGVWDSEEEARVGRRGDRAAPAPGPLARRGRDPGAGVVPDARVRGALHHARPSLPGHRRPALLRAARDPRCAGLPALRRPAGRRLGLRADLQYAQSADWEIRPCRSCRCSGAPVACRSWPAPG